MEKVEVSAERHQPRHAMRLVVARTGLSPHVLRAWERRYAVVSPLRTAGGQRLYSDEDVERLQLLKNAADEGRNIGQLAGLSNEALRALVAADAEQRAPAAPGAAAPSQPPLDSTILNRCLAAVCALETAALESELRRATMTLPVEEFTDAVLAPLLSRIGALWTEGQLGPAQEHAASAVIRRVLDDIIRRCVPAPLAPSIIVGTPAGQRHELGALLAAATASALGWQVVYLGVDLPSAELVRAAELSSARVIALSILYPPDDEDLRAELARLAAALPPGHAIILGGAAAAGYARALSGFAVYAAGSLAEFRAQLQQLEARARTGM